MQVKIDNAGRIVLPKAMRDKLQLAPGDALDLEQGENCVTLSPVVERVAGRKKSGIWVFRVGQRLSTEIVQHTLEGERDASGKRSAKL